MLFSKRVKPYQAAPLSQFLPRNAIRVLPLWTHSLLRTHSFLLPYPPISEAPYLDCLYKEHDLLCRCRAIGRDLLDPFRTIQNQLKTWPVPWHIGCNNLDSIWSIQTRLDDKDCAPYSTDQALGRFLISFKERTRKTSRSSR